LFNPTYLVKSRNGVYHLRWPIPKQLHPKQKQSSLKLSLGLRCTPNLGQRELEFSGVKAQFGGGADEPFMSEIGTLRCRREGASTPSLLSGNQHRRSS
jgi:hypothetical protein